MPIQDPPPTPAPSAAWDIHQVAADVPSTPVPAAAWDAHHVVTEIYRNEYKSLVRVAMLLVRDVPTAEEVVQDSFVAMHHAWPRLRDSQKALSYLRQAVINRARSVLRHRTVADLNAPKPMPDEPSAESGAITALERDQVVAVLRTLPIRQREAIVLRYYGGFTEAEIAAAMGISRGAVKSHMARGMTALKSKLADEIEQPDAVPGHPALVTVAVPISIYLAEGVIHAQVGCPAHLRGGHHEQSVPSMEWPALKAASAPAAEAA